MIASNATTLEIVGYSANVPALFGLGTSALLGRPLVCVCPELASMLLTLPRGIELRHELLEYRLTSGAKHFDAISHLRNGMRIVEFLPAADTDDIAQRKKLRVCREACSAILQAPRFSEALGASADATRAITRYGSVQIYRFQPDGSGEIVAESREAHKPPHLGQLFPASDIPRKVREVMSFLPCRAISNIDREPVEIIAAPQDGQPLDLTWAAARSVSRTQVAYLRKLGIRASFSASLMHDERLWGLIVANDDRGRDLAPDDWSLIQDVASTVMLRHVQDERLRAAENSGRLRQVERGFAKALRDNSDVNASLSAFLPEIARLVASDGFAFQYGSTLHLHGRTPPETFIRALLDRTQDHTTMAAQFKSTRLHREWDLARAHKETACGVLVQSLKLHRPCRMVWFRGPATRAAVSDGAHVEPFTPMEPFDRWVRVNRDQSRPWQASELHLAQEVFAEHIDILSTQLFLKEENAALRQFAETAAHDLKAPLRGIGMALEMMQEEDFDADIVRETHALATTSAKRLTVLTNGLLDLAVIGETRHPFEKTDLNRTIEEAWRTLQHDVEESGARLDADFLPVIRANTSLMLRLFLNLLGNAIKYRHPERAPQVAVRLLRRSKETLELAISDNGVGIPEESATEIFKPMARLHRQDEVEGSGLGLTICDRIAAYHGGTLALVPDGQPGARFVLRLQTGSSTPAASSASETP